MLRGSAAALAVVATAALPVWLLSSGERLAARFGSGDCRRVALIDPQTGWRIGGGEDLALTPDGATLIVSAHDRLDPARPDGGLYAVPVADLAVAEAIEARPLVDLAARSLPFRPHGIGLSADGTRLALVNRIAPHRAVVEIGTLDGAGWHGQSVVRDDRLCRANDLAFDADGEAVIVTIDRADCGNSLRDLAPGRAHRQPRPDRGRSGADDPHRPALSERHRRRQAGRDARATGCCGRTVARCRCPDRPTTSASRRRG